LIYAHTYEMAFEMKRFSEREGLREIRTEIQLDSIDNALRNRLWNVLDFYYWSGQTKFVRDQRVAMSSEMKGFLNTMWHSFYKESVDNISTRWVSVHELLKKRFFDSEWFEVYDFLEFLRNSYPYRETNDKFSKTCNQVLEEELSAYRFVGGIITKVTSEEEISEIEEALTTPLKPVLMHIENAVKLMSDRQSPDYRNSIKESISAVEAICGLITKNKKATLGQALKEVETKVGLHQALKKGFSNLYGYTSSADGIRHALLKESELSFEDAKFMLVSCSAFVNYLVSKASKAGIKIG